MSVNSTFGVLGGDQRQVFLADSIAEDGYGVYSALLEKGKTGEKVATVSVKKLAEECGIIILPLPVTRDGVFLNAPLSDEKTELSDEFAEMFVGKKVYTSMPEKLLKASPVWKKVDLCDYYSREELVSGNAFLTAEAAVALAISSYEGTLINAKCLVVGFGRIGKALCGYLRGMGASVSCCARRAEHLVQIEGIGCEPLQYRQTARPFDLIFNTVPAKVLSIFTLSAQKKDVLLMELASAPGGIDTEAAERLGLKVIDAQGLPGKYSPKASGKLIKDAVYNAMEEN